LPPLPPAKERRSRPAPEEGEAVTGQKVNAAEHPHGLCLRVHVSGEPGAADCSACKKVLCPRCEASKKPKGENETSKLSPAVGVATAAGMLRTLIVVTAVSCGGSDGGITLPSGVTPIVQPAEDAGYWPTSGRCQCCWPGGTRCRYARATSVPPDACESDPAQRCVIPDAGQPGL
jgi:hypothetical protein